MRIANHLAGKLHLDILNNRSGVATLERVSEMTPASVRSLAIAITAVALSGGAPSLSAQEISCGLLLKECGYGPLERTKNGGSTFVGGGTISSQCVGILSGVLSSKKYCHSGLTWIGAAATLIHYVHNDKKLIAKTGWECAEEAYSQAYPCN